MENGDGNYTGSRTETTEKFDVSNSTTITKYGYGDLIPELSSLSVIGYNYRVFYEEHLPQYLNEYGITEEDFTWEQFKERQQLLMPVMLYSSGTAEAGTEETVMDAELLDSLRMGTGIATENISLITYELYDFNDAQVTPIDWQLIVVFVILAMLLALLAYGLLRSNEPQEVLEVDPELSVEDLLVSTQLEEAKNEEVERLREIDYTADSEVKKQIDKFVDDKPEAVAQLLRNWLNEGWE
jgi:flagellar M-ring protein FliF